MRTTDPPGDGMLMVRPAHHERENRPLVLSLSKDDRTSAARVFLGFLALALLLASCSAVGRPVEGLAPSRAGNGPKVVWDPLAKPIPDIPLPNDLATTPDPDSPTGLRLNFPLDSPTQFERTLREKFNELDGFGIYSPMTVSFSDRIDIPALEARHRDHDFSNDAILLIALDTGQPVELDLGRGNLPWTLWKTDNYYYNDSRSGCISILVDCVEEDVNGNGVLDAGEDTDGDGRLDHPNVRGNTGHPYDDLLSYYDLGTNTLFVQPVVPLHEATTYAVVLTDRLIGTNGSPVRSPFPYVNHAMQTERLAGLEPQLGPLGLSLTDVAFVWTFTTGSPTRDLLAIRDGLNAKGPFKDLAKRFPPEVSKIEALMDPAHLPKGRLLNVHTIPAENVANVVDSVSQGLLGSLGDSGSGSGLTQITSILTAFSFKYVDYFVAGEFIGPSLRNTVCSNQKEYDPYSDHTFHLDHAGGRAQAIPCAVPFFASIPKRRDNISGPPFPVVLDAHGTGLGQVLTVFIEADTFARFGLATIGIPSPTAMSLPFLTQPPFDALVKPIFRPAGLVGLLTAEFGRGLGVDLTGDGQPDTAGDMYSAEAFKTRDNIRQTIVDHLQLVRLLRSFDGSRKWSHDVDGDGSQEIAGDFDADGAIDLGGPDVPYFSTGQSQGGMVSAVLTAVEPYIIAGAPDAPPGGFYIEAATRSALRLLSDIGMIELMGPLIVGTPGPNGTTRLSHDAVTPALFDIAGSGLNFNSLGDTTDFIALAGDMRADTLLPFAEVSDLTPGTLIRARNLANGVERSTTVGADGAFRLSLPSDRGDLWEIRYRPAGSAADVVINTTQFGYKHRGVDTPEGSPLKSPHYGAGFPRGTKEFRQFVFLGQMGFDGADPIAFAPLYRLRPPGNTPGARRSPNVLIAPTTGDSFAVVSSAISIARSAGFISYLEPDPRFGMPVNDFLIKNFVTEGIPFLRFGGSKTKPVLFDPDNVNFGKDGYDVPRSDPPVRVTLETETGVSGVRFSFPSPSGSHTSLVGGGKYSTFLDMRNRIGYYFYTGGKVILDDPCLGDGSCSQFP